MPSGCTFRKRARLLAPNGSPLRGLSTHVRSRGLTVNLVSLILKIAARH
jgi:hypothetical protein